MSRKLCMLAAALLVLTGISGIISPVFAEEASLVNEEDYGKQTNAANLPTAEIIGEKEVVGLVWDGPVLATGVGTVIGPSGKETYYNLPMEGVVRIMRNMGFSEEEYPYWVREDGCKMLGDYIMVAANLDVHPRGSLVPCSLGMALVCDTGGFAVNNPQQLDVATDW